MPTPETRAAALTLKAARTARVLDRAGRAESLGAEFDRLARARRAAHHVARIRSTGAALDHLQRARATATSSHPTAL